MMLRVKMESFVALIIGLMVVAGCASEVTKKPEVSPSSASTTRPGQPTIDKSQSAPAPRQGGATSSLEAHREGKAPASGPLVEIYFDYDSYDLRADARKALQAHAAWLKANPVARVEIEGHCDERGTTEYNLALGAKRARSARDYLVALGIAATRISTTSYGEELLVCKEKTDDCYRKNRRDRFVIIGARPTS
jgi:peptidoglycan-associated lipoprotein